MPQHAETPLTFHTSAEKSIDFNSNNDGRSYLNGTPLKPRRQKNLSSKDYEDGLEILSQKMTMTQLAGDGLVVWNPLTLVARRRWK
jgi:hypothetical protein